MRNTNAKTDPFKDFIASVAQTRRDAPDHARRCAYMRDQDSAIADAGLLLGAMWRRAETTDAYFERQRELDREDWRQDRIREGAWVPPEDDPDEGF